MYKLEKHSSYSSFLLCRRSRQEVFCKKGALRNCPKFIGKHLCRVSFQTLAQAFYCEYCKIFKNRTPFRTPPVAASVSVTFKKLGGIIRVKVLWARIYGGVW